MLKPPIFQKLREKNEKRKTNGLLLDFYLNFVSIWFLFWRKFCWILFSAFSITEEGVYICKKNGVQLVTAVPWEESAAGRAEDDAVGTAEPSTRETGNAAIVMQTVSALSRTAASEWPHAG